MGGAWGSLYGRARTCSAVLVTRPWCNRSACFCEKRWVWLFLSRARWICQTGRAPVRALPGAAGETDTHCQGKAEALCYTSSSQNMTFLHFSHIRT